MRAVVWDFDGTLGYRSGGAWVASCWELLQVEAPECQITQDHLKRYLQEGFPWHKPEQPHTHIKDADSWWEMVIPIIRQAYIGVGVNVVRAEELARKFRRIYLQLDRWRLYDDVYPALDALSGKGWTHLILSNHVPELGEIIHHLGASSHFYHIFNSAETGYEKPNPNAFAVVMKTFPHLKQIWMVGDNIEADVRGAEKVGISAILARKYSPYARYYAESLTDVLTIINDL
jgi:putative hydrolase of the HAD superfamily